MKFQKQLDWAILLTVLVNASAMFSPIINSGDAITYATLAHNIVLSDDWVRLTLDGHDWLDKPHFPFWITALFFKLGGVSALTYILPGFLFHLIGGYYTYRLARLLYGREVGLLALLIYVSVYNLMDASVEVKAETYLTGEIMPACYYWLRYEATSRPKHLLLGAMFSAMAIMTKGIFTVVTIFSGLVGLWLYDRQWRTLFSPRWFGVLVLILIFVSPELIALHLQFNQQPFGGTAAQPVSSLRFFFWDSQFGRFFNTGPIQNRNGHPLYFVLVFLWAFLPWTALFFAALQSHMGSFGKHAMEERRAFIFLACSFFCTFLMFSATKFQFDYYIDIILPFAAIVCASYLNKADVGHSLFVVQMSVVFAMLLIAASIAVYVMNMALLGATTLLLGGALSYFYSTRGWPINLRTLMYSVLAINLLYIFVVSLTATTFMQYSVAYNAKKLLGENPAGPIYVYQMPEVARELALYAKSPCHEVDHAEDFAQIPGKYYLIVRKNQVPQVLKASSRYSQIAVMDLVEHKTGTFKKLLELARGAWPLEPIELMQASPR